MTEAQIEQVKSMTQAQLISHYLRLLLSKQITQEQYETFIRKLAPYCKPYTENGDTPLCEREDVGEGESVSSPKTTTESEGVPDYGDDITDAQKEFILAFTAGENPDLVGSQKQRLLEFLSDGQWHDTLECMSAVYGSTHVGLARLSARIKDLKNDGYTILGEWKKRPIYQYRLILSDMV